MTQAIVVGAGPNGLAGAVALALLGAHDDRATVTRSGQMLVSGGDGNDRLTGAPGRDDLEGDMGDDVLVGNGGDDPLIGGRGDLV